jgi:uncharacterized membrane protein
MRHRTFLSLLLAATGAIFALSCGNKSTSTGGTGKGAPDFVKDIKPILEHYCIECHNTNQLFAGLNYESRETAFRESDRGKIISPGKPDESRFYIVLTLPPADPKAMPPVRHTVPEEKRKLIRAWIEGGAHWPDGPEGHVKPIQSTAERPA